MAIVSVQRILNTQDRTVLDMEYRNIISNLKLGNIESDPEIISLYTELMNVISGKLLTREAAERLQKDYDDWEKQQMANAFMRVRAIGPDPVTMGVTFAVSSVPSFFPYQDATKGPRKKLDEKLYKIDVQERESYNVLQTRMLNSSCRLMRQYRLPDEYRIVQDSVNDLFLAVNVEDSAKSLDMLRALEDEFRIYPPYWVYRARSAQNAGNSQEAAKCFDEFSKVWRPVLRNDPFMLEAAKYHVQEALKSGNNSEALRHLETVRENTARSDWADNLFAGVAYFVLGRKEQGINCVELNINFEAEKEISSAVLAQMKAGKLDTSALPGELRKIVGLSALRYDTLVLLAESGDLEAQLMLGKFYADGEIVSKDYAESVKWYEMAAKQNNEIAILALAGLYTQGGYNLKKNIEQAKSWYEKAAYEGSRAAQNGLAHLFFNAKDYYNAYVWCCVAEMTENFDRTLQTGFSVGVGAGAAGMAMLTGAAFLPVFLPVAGFMLIMSELGLDNNIKDDIEGAGLFSFAKLSSSEMDKAKIEAGKIMSEIERRIKQKQQQPSMP